MRTQYFEFVETTLTPVYHVRPWWDRVRWRLVRLLGGTDPFDSVKVTRIPIDADDFMVKLYKQKRHLYEYFNREPKMLLIGAEDYENMMNSPVIQKEIQFSASFHYGQFERYGLTVKVIPWMRGAVVMP